MKRIAIIGGGISGLTVLHFLKQRFGDTVEITLFEREARLGGTIRTFKKDSCLFEWGPNGFLDNQPAAIQLIEELEITDQLIDADPKARRCYIQIEKNLYAVPRGPLELLRTPLLSLKDKWSLITGIFKKNISRDLSIYDYVSRRFSPRIAQRLVDPFISGIYAGDIKRLHMASAFPKRVVSGVEPLRRTGFKKPRMRSFKGGMGQIIEALEKRYQKHIQTNSEINSIIRDRHSLFLINSVCPYLFDVVIVAAPAYAASKIVEGVNPVLSQILAQIPYAPMAVAGLLFKQDAFKKKPDGFGYLIPSQENKDILGVLIESNVYAGRSGEYEIMIRVMLGGAHHPAIINDERQQILSKAIKEIDSTYGLVWGPMETFVRQWPKAIPQYEINYPHLYQAIRRQCAQRAGLYLCANYLDGVSFNDCIKNAKSLAGLLSSQSVR